MPKIMPSRSKKNDHLGLVAKGPTRCTSARVAAEKVCEEEGRKQKKLEEAANLQVLAQLNVKADEHRVFRKSTAVRRISDIPEEDSDDVIDDKLIHQVAESSSDSEEQNDEDDEGDSEIPEDNDVPEAVEAIIKTQTKKKKQVSVNLKFVPL
jgi:hypothetical protein